jgi:hypothetical protein
VTPTRILEGATQVLNHLLSISAVTGALFVFSSSPAKAQRSPITYGAFIGYSPSYRMTGFFEGGSLGRQDMEFIISGAPFVGGFIEANWLPPVRLRAALSVRGESKYVGGTLIDQFSILSPVGGKLAPAVHATLWSATFGVAGSPVPWLDMWLTRGVVREHEKLLTCPYSSNCLPGKYPRPDPVIHGAWETGIEVKYRLTGWSTLTAGSSLIRAEWKGEPYGDLVAGRIDNYHAEDSQLAASWIRRVHLGLLIQRSLAQ